MYHIVGVTPEAATLEMALGAHKPTAEIRYGDAERRRTDESLNSNGTKTQVDYVMLGCPHASIEQIWEAARLLEGKQVCPLWLFTSRAVKTTADLNGYTKILQDAGGVIMTDTCSAIGKFVPNGAQVVALDSAKQAHYPPAMMSVEAWFGSTEDCVRAALTGRSRSPVYLG